jgi:electron transfer flavoprotein alpha subunit
VGTVLCLSVVARADASEGTRRERARAFLMVRMVEALKLSAEQAAKVSAVIRASDERREQLVLQREAVERQLRQALDKHSGDSVLLPLIASTRQLDERIAAVPEETFATLHDILSVEQQAAFLLFRRELQGEVHRAIQHRLGGPHRASTKSGHATPPSGHP